MLYIRDAVEFTASEFSNLEEAQLLSEGVGEAAHFADSWIYSRT